MFNHTKAHYNLLRMNCPTDESWEKRDYREMSSDDLFAELEQLGLLFDSPEDFEQSAEPYDSPEEMGEALLADLDEPERAFLLLFELWRRFLTEKRAVSIFCDELDHQIASYYKNCPSEEAYEIIDYLKQICDDNADSGVEPKEILSSLQHASCQDIEAFLYDYTLEQIEGGDTDYAVELIEGFYPYLIYPEWFDYLIARLEMTHDHKVGYKRLTQVAEGVQDVDFALEVLSFLADTGDPLFKKLAHRTLDFLEIEGDLIDFLECCSRYFDQDEFEESIEKRKQKDPNAPLAPRDGEIKKLKEFFSAKK